MDKNLKKALIYLLVALTAFLSAVSILDVLNSSVEEDLTEYKKIIKDREEAVEASNSESTIQE